MLQPRLVVLVFPKHVLVDRADEVDEIVRDHRPLLCLPPTARYRAVEGARAVRGEEGHMLCEFGVRRSPDVLVCAARPFPPPREERPRRAGQNVALPADAL